MNGEGKVEKQKAHLIAKCYYHMLILYFGDFFSRVAKVTSIILLLSIGVSFDIEVEQMDLKTTFLHEDLKEEI